MDSKKMLSAFLIAIFLLGMANLAAISNASSPQSSNVTIGVFVENGGNQVGVSATPTVYVNSTSGYQVSMFTMDTSNNNMITLPYGTYIFTALPTNTTLAGKVYFTNKSVQIVDVSKPYVNVTMNQTSVLAKYTQVNLSGLDGQTATLLFSSMNGNVFNKVTTSASTFSTYLPSAGTFNVVVYFNGNPDDGQEFFNVLPSTSGLSLNLSTSTNYFGTVYLPNGNTPSAVKAVVYNEKSNSYSIMRFSSASFYVSTASDNWVILECSGCNPINITGQTGVHSFHFTNSISNVTTTYHFGKNLRNVTMNETIGISGNTEFPGVPGASSGYLAIQEMNANFQNQVKSLLSSVSQNSYYLFTANNTYYNLTGKVSYSLITTANGELMASVEANFQNMNMNRSDYKNLVLNVFQNNQYNLKYTTMIYYDNTSYSVKSATSAVSYSNPFEIYPVSSPQWVTVNFGKSQKPVFMNGNIMVYYSGIKTTDSVLNSSSSNGIIVVPIDKNVSINISNTLYNPINGQYQYLSPVNFSWNVSGKMLTNVAKPYNLTYNFTSTITNIMISGTDSSNFTNTTNLTVIALPSSYMPYVNLSYTVNGKNHTLKYTPMSGMIMAHIHVNQNQVVKFNAQASSLNYTYMGKKYSLQLVDNWAFPNYTTSGAVVSYKYTVPSVKAGIENSYLNITSSANTTTSVMIMAYVNDTTPPDAVVTLQNGTHGNISSVLAGTPMIITANYSSDQYYKFSDLKFNWTLRYANGTIMNLSSKNFTVIAYNTSATSWNASNWVMVEFDMLSDVHIDLQVSNPNVTAYSNNSYAPAYSGPQLVVSSFYFTGSFTQGTTKTVNVNVTNKGTGTATSLTIIVKVGSSVVGSQTYSNISLTTNQTKTFTVNVSFPNAGSNNVVVLANTTLQPSFIEKNGEYSTTISVGASPYKIPLVIAAIVVIIVIIGLLYYRVTQGTFPWMKKRNQQTSMPAKPKTTDQKPADNKNNKKQ
ncbi:CARDB domain-containing protein [Cuniculiplasma sp. SKW4]|uniref:CARDB domain-containing protein n=1 Tax=Cuniculiplasma sp. SKW4 TaxID=3400171 RepID=UPI003FCFE3A0